MILSMNSQIHLFLLTVLIGMSTGFLYDILKIIRKILPHRNLFVQVEDFIFWIGISTAVFYIMLNKNSGQIRGFCIGGALFGMMVYSIAMSKFVVNILVLVLNATIKVVGEVLSIMFYPIKIMLKLLFIPLKAIYNICAPYFLNLWYGTKRYLYLSNRYAKIRGKRFRNNMRIIFKKI